MPKGGESDGPTRGTADWLTQQRMNDKNGHHQRLRRQVAFTGMEEEASAMWGQRKEWGPGERRGRC